MENILFLSDVQQDGTISRGALETLSAALSLAGKIAGSKLVIGLVGGDTQKSADSLGAAGAQQILTVSGPDFAQSRYASDTFAICALAREAQASVILAPSTSRFQRSLSGAAARLGGTADSHITGLNFADGQIRVQRWYYRQRMIASLTRKTRPWCLLIESGIFSAYSGPSKPASVKDLKLALPENQKRTAVTGIQSPSSGVSTIRPDAKVLFVAGAGWMKKQSDGKAHVKAAESLIMNFLEQTQSSLGSSKSLVDQGGEGQEVMCMLSHLNQIGQTGSSPRHPKGLATCCHGEEPHVVGWRFINERRAVNLDANCGWAQGKADVLYVADAFKVMEKVNAILAKQPAGV